MTLIQDPCYSTKKNPMIQWLNIGMDLLQNITDVDSVSFLSLLTGIISAWHKSEKSFADVDL